MGPKKFRPPYCECRSQQRREGGNWICCRRSSKLLHGILPEYRTHGFVHWFYNLENSIPIHVHECTILENPFPINVHEYYILENPIHINVRTSLQTKITVKLNIKIWKYLLQKCVFCVHFDDFLFDMTHKGIENML